MTAWNKHHTELAQNEVSPVDAKGKPSTSSRSPFRPPPVPSALMENPSCHSAMGGHEVLREQLVYFYFLTSVFANF